MASICPILKFREFDANGDPLIGGKIYTYIAGTTVPASTFTDESGSVPNSNPIILDSEGRADIWLSDSTSYKFIVKDADDNTVFTADDVSISGGSASAQSAWTSHDITDNQSATDLTSETMDVNSYSSAIYEYEIIRGTTVISNGTFAIQNLNGTGRVVTGLAMASEPHGVTFSVSQIGSIIQLKAALDTGAGNGTIKLSRKLIAQAS